MKSKLILLSLLTIVVLIGCSANDRTSSLPEGYCIVDSCYERKAFDFSTDEEEQKKIDEMMKEYLVDNNVWPLITRTDFNTPTTIQNVYEPVVFSSMGIKETKAVMDKSEMLKSRRFFATTAGFNGVIPYVNSELVYENVMELELNDQNPQFSLKRKVNPISLIKWQFKYENAEKKERTVVLFHKYVSAPEILMLHTLKKAETKAEFDIAVTLEAGYLQEHKKNLSRRFVLRRYGNAENVKKIVQDGNIRMFVKCNEEEIKNGKKLYEILEKKKADSPQEDVYLDIEVGKANFKYNGEFYTCSSEYADHLASEGIMFRIYLDEKAFEGPAKDMDVRPFEQKYMVNEVK